MVDRATCPDQETLERLLVGQVPDELAGDLEQHLLACPHCCRRLREFSQESSAALGGVARAAVELANERAVMEVAERAVTLRLPGRSGAFTDTLAADDRDTTEGWDFRTILDPPQAEGELGRFGGYRVLRVLGMGGMGLVWEAEDPQLRRHVALKVMKPALAKQAEHRERFLREARAAAAIDHSHIVTVYQVGEHRGLPFLAMQLLRGETLDDLLRREGRLPLAECLRIGRQMAEALAVAHRRGLIHRDVKPANTWLEADGGWVKLVDFGLAHALEDDSHLTQTGTILGTPAYMSPEQARGEPVDARSDLFSLGAVLYRMTTGLGPFVGPSTLAVLTSLALNNPEPPGQVNRDVPPELSDLIMRLLAKNPADRPQSAEAVAAAIREMEARSPKSEVQSPMSEAAEAEREQRTGSGVGRRRWSRLVLAAAGVAAVLLAGITVIVRDKHGNIISKLFFPDAQTADVTHTDVAPKPAYGSVAEGDAAAPPAIQQPPPLDEWLKGRQILTVSQDGRGQFKTIQAALGALQPGQVVEVLDAGPYRETLGGTQTNFGLISRAGTVIELVGTRMRTWEKDLGNNHFFDNLDGCRLSGLTFVAKVLPETLPPSAPWLMLAVSGDLVVERCRFAGGEPNNGNVGVLVFCPTEGQPRPTCVVRECCFDTALNLAFSASAPKREQRYLIERNWFRSVPQPSPLTVRGRGDTLIIRHNVFDGKQPGGLHMHDLADTARLEVYNNTFASGRSRFFGTLGVPSAIIRNNYLARGIGAEGDTASALGEIASRWQVVGNRYRISPSGSELPLTPADTVGQPGFLSADAASSDYLRVASGSDEARRGAGGAWPDYIGALPPGPAPKDGDWLTRWIKAVSAPRSNEIAALSPAKMSEPPPLDEWLKGRKILTVSQDGKGQFTTIQAALDALEPGQAVQVLDRGPYRESLTFRGQKNVGVFSRAGATILSGGTRKPVFDEDTVECPNLSFLDDFRIRGITFFANANDLSHLKPHVPWLTFGLSGDTVIENCRFAGGRSESAPVLIHWRPDAGPGAVCTVRDCLFDAGITVNLFERRKPVAIIERNWFRAPPQYFALYLHGPGERVVVRHNVFDIHDKMAMALADAGDTRRLEICNNTLLAASMFGASDGARGDTAAPGDVVIRNNLFKEGIGCSKGLEDALARAAKGWEMGHNQYAKLPKGRDKIAPAKTDFIGAPVFLSNDSGVRDYLRIAAEGDEAHRGTGGDWPDYLGALPPGPAPKEGDWLTFWIKLRVPASTPDISPAPPGAQPRSVEAASPTAEIPEPPPLDDWLKGRKILTVSQDGRGQFKNIQAALDALEPGQAVEVLDRGPYRETLLANKADDAGLISRVGTVIELGEKRAATSGIDNGECHNFYALGRLSGLTFVLARPNVPEPANTWLSFAISSDTCIENCRFTGGGGFRLSMGLYWRYDCAVGAACRVRDCLLETGMGLWCEDSQLRPVAVVERNWFRSTPQCGSLSVYGPADRVIVRHNVFDGFRKTAAALIRSKGAHQVEIYNNTFAVGEILLSGQLTTTGVMVRNNLFCAPIAAEAEAQPFLAAAALGWQMGNNQYAKKPEGDGQLAQTVADFIGEPQYLSREANDANYLRIASGSDEAQRGTGGGWPTYLGALPPGPAPKEGDWLTRWIKAAPAGEAKVDPPSAVPDPPPLEEWLKDRKLLTVSKDGKGDFQTIQAALDALRPGLAVEVLDRGPYRETLRVPNPENAGLVSRVGTVVEFTGKREPVWDKDPANDHSFGGVRNFRLSGFSFIAGQLEDRPADMGWIVFPMNGDLVIENCRFADRRPDKSGLFIYWYATAPRGAVCHVRNCSLETSATINVTDDGRHPTAIVERNWIRKRSLMIHGSGKHVVVRNNVFDGEQIYGLSLLQTERIGRLEIYNNTFLSRIFAHNNLPATNAVLRNNLLLFEPLTVGPAGLSSLAAAAQGWEVGNNEYAEAPELAYQFPKTANDFVAAPKFISDDPGKRDYMRIAADSDEARRGTGGEWPSYLGAVPPGPSPEEGDWLTRWIDAN